ncbi:MAG: hypothetical protein U0R19_12100 [Bryobacteraceae bacterium]
MKEQMTTLDPARRFTLFGEVQRILSEERPLISMVSPNILVAARQAVGNFHPAMLDLSALWNAEFLYRIPKH